MHQEVTVAHATVRSRRKERKCNERWCLHERLKLNLARHTIDPQTHFIRATGRRSPDAKAENESRWPHDNPDERVFFAMTIMLRDRTIPASPLHIANVHKLLVTESFRFECLSTVSSCKCTFIRATGRQCLDAKAENKSRWQHDNPDERVF